MTRTGFDRPLYVLSSDLRGAVPTQVFPRKDALNTAQTAESVSTRLVVYALCGSGVGASVCANKVQGIRSALIPDHRSARQGVEDDHISIICLGGCTVGSAVAWDLIQKFLAAEFSQAGRHLRRLAKVAARESQGDNHECSTHN
jgi:RpiB/LacA/LacB family sugar-phosphate isomerase